MSFRESLVIMTSNIGSAAISGSAVGFQLSAADGANTENAAYSRIKEHVTDELKVQCAWRSGIGQHFCT